MIEFNGEPFSALPTLPFINVDDGGINFWAVCPSEDYAADCARGRGYADALISYVKETSNVPFVARVLAAMPPSPSGVEIGFASEVAMALLRN